MIDEAKEEQVTIVLVMGPYSYPGALGELDPTRETSLEALRARVVRMDATTEKETAEALQVSCDAIVLDPGSTEFVGGVVTDVVRRLAVPVVIVRDRQEHEVSSMGMERRVTPYAAASLTGGGPVAYEAALEAAAWFAWEARRNTHVGDVVPTRRIAEPD